MKSKITLFLLFGMTLLLNACLPIITSADASDEHPVPVVEYDLAASNYQPVTVDDVRVEIGVGSPIPVFVHVSGNLPDPCSQIEHTQIEQNGSTFIINLFATPDIGGPAVDGCIKDPIPFTMSIPLSVVDMPAGSYSVLVNGSRADFELDTANTASTLPTADTLFNKADIIVDDVRMEIGVGSPIPVHAVISANLPSVCAQLGEVRVHRDGTRFFVRLVAYVPAEEECSPDTLPFRLEVPLNVIGLEAGTYTVNANGTSASFEFPLRLEVQFNFAALDGETAQPLSME